MVAKTQRGKVQDFNIDRNIQRFLELQRQGYLKVNRICCCRFLVQENSDINVIEAIFIQKRAVQVGKNNVFFLSDS